MGELHNPMTPPDLGILCANSIYLLLGIYGWEYLRSIQVESGLIRMRVPFRLSLIPYILGRISLLVYFILLAIGTSPYSRGMGCIAGAMTISILGNTVLGCSSTNFVIRTWVIWKDSRLVHALLFLFALGQFALLVANAVLLRPINVHGICEISPRYQQFDGVTYLYTSIYDLFVVVLSVVGLSTQSCTSPLKRRLRAQGLLYVVIAGIAYIPPMVSALLNNTPVFNLTCNIAITTSTIMSSWAVRTLLFLDTDDSNQGSEIALDTQIGVQRSTVAQDDVSTCEQHSVDVV